VLSDLIAYPSQPQRIRQLAVRGTSTFFALHGRMSRWILYKATNTRIEITLHRSPTTLDLSAKVLRPHTNPTTIERNQNTIFVASGHGKGNRELEILKKCRDGRSVLFSGV